MQKIIARAGIASRREAEEIIQQGRVSINGKIIRELGTRADLSRDHIKVDGKLITRPETLRYILLNKPREVMTTVEDPEGRATVMQLLSGVRERVFPVGRLDYHSEGLILLTNDGELAHRVSHPSLGPVKIYHVKVKGIPEGKDLAKLERGITIDGQRTRPCEIERLRTTGRGAEAGNTWLEVRLGEGRTQQIRKMFHAIGHPVSKLRRVAIGSLRDEALDPGQWRELTPREIRQLSGGAAKRPRKTSPREKAGEVERPRRPSRRKVNAGGSTGSKRKKTGTGKATGPVRKGAKRKR